LASLLAISVFPTPVGPIMSMFFGAISSLSSGETRWRRQRFLSAIDTARLALFWPMIYLSSSETISLGVKNVSLLILSKFLYRDFIVGINAYFGRYLEGFLGYLPCGKVREPAERLGRGLCERAARAY